MHIYSEDYYVIGWSNWPQEPFDHWHEYCFWFSWTADQLHRALCISGYDYICGYIAFVIEAINLHFKVVFQMQIKGGTMDNRSSGNGTFSW